MNSKVIVQYDPEYVKITSCHSLNVTLANYEDLRDAKIDEIFMNHIDDSTLINPSIEFLNNKRGVEIEVEELDSPVVTAEGDYRTLVRFKLIGDLNDIDFRYIDLNYTVTGFDTDYDDNYFTVFKLSDVDKDCASWVTYHNDDTGESYQAADVMMIALNREPKRLVMGSHRNHIAEFDRICLHPNVYDY